MELTSRGTSPLGIGCMGLGGGWNDTPPGAEEERQAHALVDTALELGLKFFDHADIYTFGKAETVFGRVLAARPGLRDQLHLQSKAGIRLGGRDGVRVGHYDLSKDYLLKAVEGILSRLGTPWLDTLLLHRPDPLMEPEEIAAAFEVLKSRGQVRAFGVSNMSGPALRRLARALPEGTLEVNQLELSLGKADFLEAGVTFNHASRERAPWFSEGTLETCLELGLQLQAWSPLAGGRYTGRPTGNERDRQVSDLLHRLSAERGVSPEGLLTAWLLRHPARILPILGTTHPDRLRACAQGLHLHLDRDTWNELWVAARGEALP